MSDPQVVWHEQSVTRAMREQSAGQRGCVLWFTGLSGSGKSTVANAVDQKLFELGVRSYVLDGDNVRHGLNATPAMLTERHGEEFGKRFGLGFGQQDREENIRRIGSKCAKLFCGQLASLSPYSSFISPYARRSRQGTRDARLHEESGEMRFHRDLRGHARWKRAESPRSQGSVQKSPRRRDQGISLVSTIPTRRPQTLRSSCQVANSRRPNSPIG